MSVNGVTSNQTAAAYSYPAADTAKTEAAASANVKVENSAAAEAGAVYEPSRDTVSPAKTTYKPDTNLINKLKADADARTAQMRSMVEKMMAGQAGAYGKANDMWSFLSKGDFTVDPATQKQAQADIAEDGYWGVAQTSDRILEFAKALTGGNPDKIESMRSAFEKGYKQAEKTWGRSLPDISKRTYDAVMEKFDKWAEQAKKETAAATAKTQAAQDPTK